MADRSAYDRFQPPADVMHWHGEAFHQGSEARTMDFDIESQNPYERGTWLWKSYRAGWADCDMTLRSEKEN